MKSKIGIAVIILMYVISLNPYSLIFTLPVFVIGCILLWLGKTSTKRKIVFTIAPFILWYPGFIGFIFLNSYLGPKFAQKIEYRIPRDFRGQVSIVFPIECGQVVQKENGREIIDVPKNGIVYYQGIIEPGYINWIYKLQDPIKTSAIYEFQIWHMTEEEMNKISPDSLGVFGGGGWSTSSMYSEHQINYEVRTLIVDEWNNKDFNHYEKKQDSLQTIYEKEIRKCKKVIHQDI